MATKKLFAVLVICLTHQLCRGQINILDSCGLDSGPLLNKYEIKILDSLFFPAVQTKKTTKMTATDGFSFDGKKISFYSCTINSNTNGKGLLSKKDFFSLCRPDFKGHAGRGLIILTEKEKVESNGFDAVIIIDCPYMSLKTKEHILKLTRVKD